MFGSRFEQGSSLNRPICVETFPAGAAVVFAPVVACSSAPCVPSVIVNPGGFCGNAWAQPVITTQVIRYRVQCANGAVGVVKHSLKWIPDLGQKFKMSANQGNPNHE
jgi:hypothetical protein